MNNSDQQETQNHLKEINQQLESLKNSVLLQLSQEIEQLQKQKNLLVAEVQELANYRQQQLQQQQNLAQEIAPAIAQELQKIILQQLAQQGLNNDQSSLNALNNYNLNVEHLITSLDFTLRNIFQSLQQDLNSYQSLMSQQLSQMYSLEQQGEHILDALLLRIKEELQKENLLPAVINTSSSMMNQSVQTLSQPTNKEKEIKPKNLFLNLLNFLSLNNNYNVRLGFILMICSAFAFYFQNIVITVIFNQSSLFNFFEIGGYLDINLGNTFLIFTLRIVSFLPILFLITKILSPNILQDLKIAISNKNLLLWISLSSFFLFISTISIYISLSLLPAGISITIFFIFQLITSILSGLLLRKKPSLIEILGILLSSLGLGLIFFDQSSNLSNLGTILALFSGLTFAIHLMIIQIWTKKIDPVPFSLINFTLMLIFSLISLIISFSQPSWKIAVESNLWNNIIISSIFLGILTLLGYLANNLGLKLIGSNRASSLTSIGPILTTLLGWLFIGQSLMILQILAVLLVTMGIIILNLQSILKK